MPSYSHDMAGCSPPPIREVGFTCCWAEEVIDGRISQGASWKMTGVLTALILIIYDYIVYDRCNYIDAMMKVLVEVNET